MGSTVIKVLFAMFIFSYTWLFQEENQEWDRLRQLLKSANNLSTHDAVQLARKDTINNGKIVIESTEAYEKFLETLRLNLGLDADLQPRDISPLTEEVRIIHFEVIDEQSVEFPYLYENSTYRIAKHLEGPAVIAVIETAHPSLIRRMVEEQPIRVPAIHEKKINAIQ